MSSVRSVVTGVLLPSPLPLAPAPARRRRAYIRLFTRAMPVHTALLGALVCAHFHNVMLLGTPAVGLMVALVLTVGLMVGRVQVHGWADQDAALRAAGHVWCTTITLTMVASLPHSHLIDWGRVIAEGKMPLIAVVMFVVSVLGAILHASLDIDTDVHRPTVAIQVAVVLLKLYLLDHWQVRGTLIVVVAIAVVAYHAANFLYAEAAAMDAYRVEKEIQDTAQASLDAAIAHKKVAKLEAALRDANETVLRFRAERDAAARRADRGGDPLFARVAEGDADGPATYPEMQPTIGATCCARLAADVSATVAHALELNGGSCASASVATLESSCDDVKPETQFDKTKRRLRAPIKVTSLAELALDNELRRLKHNGRGCGSAA